MARKLLLTYLSRLLLTYGHVEKHRDATFSPSFYFLSCHFVCNTNIQVVIKSEKTLGVDSCLYIPHLIGSVLPAKLTFLEIELSSETVATVVVCTKFCIRLKRTFLLIWFAVCVNLTIYLEKHKKMYRDLGIVRWCNEKIYYY